MTSEVDICNLALTRIGHLQISSLDEGTKASDLCKLHYLITRDAVLRAHTWNFSVRRKTLALSGTSPNHEFTYQHALPEDCLKVIRTNWETDYFTGPAYYGYPGVMGYAGAGVPYRIEGRFLLCNETVAKIEYIAKVEDPNQYDSLFTDLLASRLAAELAISLTDNRAAAEEMWKIYQMKVNEARTMDAQEGSPRDAVDLSPWLTARR
ncbi:MAG: hypothetical protein EB165_03610 [Euryarchaeota archaeon]|nr:hypothetical protein [Euryarchaeota archaeon]